RERPSFISHDAGRTWREYQPRVRTADSVPDGVVPSWPCDEEVCKEAGLGWHDPLTGDWMVLRNNPPPAAYAGLAVGFDGSLWAYGPDEGGELRVALSRDRGRTWLDRSPDPQTTPAADAGWLGHAVLTAYDGDTAYLHRAGDTGEPDPFDLFRTTDGGESWQRVPAALRFADVVGVWTNREGGLVVVDMNGHLDNYQYLSTDGGETYTRVHLPVSLVVEVRGGMYGRPGRVPEPDTADFYVSEDGITWRPVEVPHYPDRYPDPSAFPSPSFPSPSE